MSRNIIGVESRGMPKEPCHTQDYKVVLVRQDNICSAYIGVGEAEWVARHGDFVQYGALPQYFPFIEADMARLGITYGTGA